MSYEELMKDTDALVRRVLIQNAIKEWIIVIALMAALVFVVILMLNEHREKMKVMKARRERLEAERITLEKDEQGHWSAYRPTVKKTRVDENGVTYTLYGKPELADKEGVTWNGKA